MKKRLISMAVAAMISCCAMPLTTSAEDNIIDTTTLTLEEALVAGYDFNGDGIVSYRDANLVLQYSAFLMMEVSSDEILEEMGADVVEAIEANGDINGDGKINPVDVTNMLQTCIDIIKNGDVNEDGVVDPTDASLILECYSKKSLGDSYNDRYTEMAISFIGDIDGIQGLTPSDASAVLRKYVENSMQ